MHVPRPTIASAYLRDMVASLDGGVRARLLAGHGLVESNLVDETFRVPQATYRALHHAVVRAADDELFGMMARPVPRGAFAALVRMLARYRTARDCIHASAAFYAMFDGEPHWHWAFEAGEATVTLETHTPGQARSVLFVHMMVLTPFKTIGWLVGQSLRARHAVLDRRLARFAAETRFLLGCAPAIGDHNALTLPADLLDMPVLRRPDEVEAWLPHSLADLISPPAPTGIEGRVREVLAAAAPLASLDLPETARHLHCSRATLARRLQAVGTSFQAVKDELRRDFAVAQLSRPERTVEAVGEALGYSDARAFRRAFKGWTGVPPGRFRG